LGLSVSDTLLQGCQPVIVEGPSDQYYFSAMKNYLIGRGMLAPSRELIFVPGGGVRGIGAVVSIVAAKDEELPYVVVDSDKSGVDLANKLKSGVYQSSTDRLLRVGDLIDMGSAEVEDLMPPALIARVASRNLLRQAGIDRDFEDEVKDGFAIVPQIEDFAGKHGITLHQGWKVELAKAVKSVIAYSSKDPLRNEEEYLSRWQRLFESVVGTATKPLAIANS
jgi:hypothetical protein